MNRQFARNGERLTRVRDFGATHSSSFAADSRAAHLFSSLSEAITELQRLSSTQASGLHSTRETTASLSLAREAVVDDLRAISLTARSLAHTIPGLENKFRRPRKVRDQELLATARAFAKDVAPLKSEFIAFELPADFLEDLGADIAAFEAALTERHTTQHSKSAATTSMESVLDRGVSIVQQLQAAVQNKFHNDDGLSMAWKRASGVERSHRPGSSQDLPTTDTGEGKTAPEPPKTSTGAAAA